MKKPIFLQLACICATLLLSAGETKDPAPLPPQVSTYNSTSTITEHTLPKYLGKVHWITGVYKKDKSIVIECGAEFTLSYFDVDTASQWLPGTLVQISQASSITLFSDYKITNLVNSESVSGNVTKGPDPANSFSKKIVAINSHTQEIALNDGNCYQLENSKKTVLDTWHIGDYVLIGHNSNWFRGKYDYIIINDKAENYATAHHYR